MISFFTKKKVFKYLDKIQLDLSIFALPWFLAIFTQSGVSIEVNLNKKIFINVLGFIIFLKIIKLIWD
jgi:hypothetical protein